ncbi:oligosaccharide flippase family protein [Marinimicrobium sp. LS-A18]|uniref:oligosaccharide flippase family protein n=1 Tax=Marinimicrobium sp. LS-A18 TaxID=1381596 RepID=UPI0004679922|nr:oligosaccharide flippase family protein [Marinimicrobium sp. LS-A18]
MSVARTLLAGSITRVTQTVISMLVAFFMMPFLVGELGDHWYGVWTVIGSLAAAYHLFDMGMAGAITRYVSYALGQNDDHDANRVINTSLSVYVGIALVLTLVSALAAWLAPQFLSEGTENVEIIQWVMLIVGVSVALEFPFNALAGVASAKLRFHQVALARIVTTLLGAGFTVYAVKQGYGIVGIAVVSFLTARLSNLMYFLICRSAFPELRFGRKWFSGSKLKELFGYSFWAFIIAIAYQMRNNVDNFVVAGALSAAMVTHYYIGARLVEFLGMMLSQATNMFVPIFTQYFSRDDQSELREKLIFVTRINFFIALICAGGLTILGDAFIRSWMGDGYRDAYWVMVILLIGRMIGFANHPLNSALYAANRHHIIAKIDVIEVIVNLVLSLILVQYLGLIGVALGTMIPLVFFRIIFLPLYGCRAIGISMLDYYRSFVRPALVVMPLLIAFYALMQWTSTPNSLPLILIVGMLGGGLIAALGVRASFPVHERKMLGKLIPLPGLRRLFIGV